MISENLIYDSNINFAGIAVGDPILNWRAQMPTYASTLYGMGLLMFDEREIIEKVMSNAVQALDSNCTAAFDSWNSVWNDDRGGGLPGLFAKFTGSSETENSILSKQPSAFNDGNNWLDQAPIKKALHYNNLPQNRSYKEGGRVYSTMVNSGDFCNNATDLYAKLWFEADIDLMIYSSSVDPLLGPPTTEAGVRQMWTDAIKKYGDQDAKMFWNSPKTIWRSDGEKVSGFARCFQKKKRFCYTVIKNGGHEVPAFQPKASYDMIWRFIEGRQFQNGSSNLPKCHQCGGVPPFAGSALTACVKK